MEINNLIPEHSILYTDEYGDVVRLEDVKNILTKLLDVSSQLEPLVMPNEVVAGVTDYCTKRIEEIVSDKRYNRKNPATIQTNAPLALMQTAWETEVETLKKINIMLNKKPA